MDSYVETRDRQQAPAEMLTEARGARSRRVRDEPPDGERALSGAAA